MTATTIQPALVQQPRSAQLWLLLGRYGALMMLAALVLVMSALKPDTFATGNNVVNILNQSALSAVIAMGLTFTLVTGEFDLSIGNTASLAGVVACTVIVRHDLSIPVAILSGILVGILIGLLNGFVVTVLGVNALVATLGVGTLAVGVNYAIAGGTPVSLSDPDGFLEISLGRFLGIPYPVYIMAGLALLAWVVLNRTVLGRSMQAAGGNATAAELSGIRVDRVRVVGFVICGALAGLTGVLLATRTGSAAVSAGDTYLLAAFAAAFFGSAVLRDGQFHIIGTVIGVITVAVGFNAIALLGMETYWQYFFQGLVLIIGVGVGTVARRRAAK
ncbi:ribose transport system permease protein [Nocardioides sp. J9]|uniref:ABC transporter permease n=1 Tax=unclassified Nocardioides TaxID=2615069 RepID=UPI0004AE2190|nr:MULTISPECIES: ABC transporter permease [unclassified Nocardioides]TWH02674.1 ribose transport system permease protein [Nocardioides sp. J9]